MQEDDAKMKKEKEEVITDVVKLLSLLPVEEIVKIKYMIKTIYLSEQ